MKYKQLIIVLLLIIGWWLVAEGWLGKRGLWRVRQLIKNYQQVVEQTNQIQETNLALQKEIKRFKHDKFWVEKQTREKLGWVKPGEVVYKFKKVDVPSTTSERQP